MAPRTGRAEGSAVVVGCTVPAARRPAHAARAGAWLLLGALSLLGAPACLRATDARAEVRVEISLDPDAIPVGETAVLAVTVTGTSGVDQGPDIPDAPGLTFRGAGQSTNISIVNGRMTRSVAWNFLVVAEKPGQYTIGPVEVREKGKAYRSGTAVLNVGGGGAAGLAQGGTGGGGGAPQPGRAGPGVAVPPPDEIDQASGDLFARASIDRDRVLLGDQVTLRFQVWVPIDVPVLESQVVNLPATEGFWREDLPPQRSSTTNVRGRMYQISEFAFALFPTRAGRLDIGEGVVDLVIQDRRGGRRSIDPFGFFANYPERRVQLRSKALSVRVDPLPEPRPADFTGGVGTFRLRGALERAETGQNEPLSLVLTVEGTGNVSTVGDPRLPEMPGVRTYSSGSEVQSSRDGDQLRGTKTFKFVLVPEGTGRKEVPPIRFSVFDPRERRFVALETPPLPYLVTASTAPSGGSGEVARTGRDLRTIRTGGSLDRIGMAEPWRTTRFWLLQAIPLLILTGGLFLRTRRQRREADWGGFLSRGSPGRLRRELEAIPSAAGGDPGPGYDHLDAALERYFTDRFHLPVRGLTREEFVAELARQGVSEEGNAAARALLDRCDFARFAPAARSASDLAELINAARDLPARLETSKKAAGTPRSKGNARAGSGPTAAGLGLLVLAAGAILGGSIGAASGVVAASGVSAAASVADPGAGLPVPLGRSQALTALARGREDYGRGDFGAALGEFRSILAAGYESPELYLGLGNASYREGRLGWAVYWFARGCRLTPDDPDLRTNLESVLAETRDHATAEAGSRFLGSLAALQDRISPASAARWFAAAWLVYAVWLAVRLAFGGGTASGFTAARWFRLAGAVLGALLAVSVAGVLVKLAQASGTPTAVVVADELPIRSNPDPEATVEFTLHAGTRVRLGRASGDFREVLYSEKLHGWGSGDGMAGLSDDGVRGAAARAW